MIPIASPSRKKLLFIANRSPYPPLGGDRLRKYQILMGLAEGYEVHLALVGRERLDADKVAFYRDHGIACSEHSLSLTGSLMGMLRALFTGDPLQVGYYYSTRIHREMSAMAQSFNGVISSLIRTGTYASGPVTLLDMCDLISLNYERSINHTASFFWRLIYAFEKNRVRRTENAAFAQFTRVLLINPAEIDSLQTESGSVRWQPNYVDDRLFAIGKTPVKPSPTVCFLGKMDYQPNIDASLWFCREVMPLLSSEFTFSVYGACLSPSLARTLKNLSDRVVIRGFMDDPFPSIAESTAMVAPMITGGGVQNKILESMALGLPVLASPLALSGIPDIRDMETACICTTPSDYAESIHRLWKDGPLRDRLRSNSRNLALRYFSKEAHTQLLMRTLKEIL